MRSYSNETLDNLQAAEFIQDWKMNLRGAQ